MYTSVYPIAPVQCTSGKKSVKHVDVQKKMGKFQFSLLTN